MKNKRIIILLMGILFALCFVILFVAKQFYVNDDSEQYTVQYYTGYYVYDIHVVHSQIDVKKKEIVQCVVDPCYPIEVDHFTMRYTKEHQQFFKDLFQGQDTDTLIIDDTNLNAEQKKIMNQIIKTK